MKTDKDGTILKAVIGSLAFPLLIVLFVRHPGYLGGLLFLVMTPLILGSLWACIPAVLSALILVVRTGLEDRTLQAELPGYSEYAGKVRHRLVPAVG